MPQIRVSINDGLYEVIQAYSETFKCSDGEAINRTIANSVEMMVNNIVLKKKLDGELNTSLISMIVKCLSGRTPNHQDLTEISIETNLSVDILLQIVNCLSANGTVKDHVHHQ